MAVAEMNVTLVCIAFIVRTDPRLSSKGSVSTATPLITDGTDYSDQCPTQLRGDGPIFTVAEAQAPLTASVPWMSQAQSVPCIPPYLLWSVSIRDTKPNLTMKVDTSKPELSAISQFNKGRLFVDESFALCWQRPIRRHMLGSAGRPVGETLG